MFEPKIMRDVRKCHHYHSCVKCGNIWDHDPPGPDVSRATFDRMHSCDFCGNSTDCDIASQDREEAEEFAVHGYITINGRRHYA